MSDRWFLLPSVPDAEAPPVATLLDAATDLTPYIEEIDRFVRDLTYRYAPPEPLVAEGARTAWQVIWSGVPGPALVREVVMLVDSEGAVTVEPVGDWQDTTVVDDRGGPTP